MASSKRPAEIGEGCGALVKNDTKPYLGRVAIHHERSSEVRHLKDRPCGQSTFECLECRRCIIIPHKRVPSQETREWSGDNAEVAYELAVVAGETQEAPQAMRR